MTQPTEPRSLLESALRDIEMTDEALAYPDAQTPKVMYLRAIAKALVAMGLRLNP